MATKSFLNKAVPRRQFLKVSSAAAVGFAAAGLMRPDALFAAPDTPASVPILGVGFTPDAASSRGVPLGDAQNALGGDPAFLSHGARLTINSFSPGARLNTLRGGVIDAIFPINGRTPEKYPRFQAWTYVNKDSGLEYGQTSFTMPVTATDGIQLVVRRFKMPGGAAVTESPLSLSLGTSNGAYKLQKGTYVVAFRDGSEGETAPVWSRLTLTRHNDGTLAVAGAKFTYVILTVDYAK